MAQAQAQVGVIGGSGLYQMPDLVDVSEVAVATPFGPPSDVITLGTLAGIRVAFLPRHGRAHQFDPTHVPARANFWAFKSLGVGRVISVSAVGSMREEIHPLDVVVPDQIFDRTTSRARSFFEDGIVAHVALAEPFCAETRAILIESARLVGPRSHDGGTYICIEGPQFSTKAESRVYRSWGVDVIGMTAMPEARLAREAGLCFAVLALVTDYDVWHETEAAVSVQAVVENLKRNVETARATLRLALPRLASARGCLCGASIRDAIITAPDAIPPETRERLALLLEPDAGWVDRAR